MARKGMFWPGGEAQSVECLPAMQKPSVSSPAPHTLGRVAHTPVTSASRRESRKIKINLSYPDTKRGGEQ